MSNHQTNTSVWNRLRRGLAGLLALALLLGLLPGTVVSAYAASANSSWAMPYAQKLVDWGVMRGDISGNLRLGDSITRAEFVTMMNRAYGYTKMGEHPFTDVRSRDWYAEDIAIAYNMGYFHGTSPTTASPLMRVSREQATVLLGRNMMLQTKAGESLGFSDSRTLSEWSRGLVAAAAESGLVSGMSDGSFQPKRNITRGEVAAMLVRAIGTPIQTPGDHTLGNVYGNVTVNTAGVKLRDGVIAGNLYLTGGVDLGDVLLENITVLGEIIVSGGGESHSSQSSITLRNVSADSMVVDSISGQFVTIRAEGNTDIPKTTVRTNAYVDDSSLPGFGLSFIDLDGEPGSLFQLAGNIKEVLNRTPQSDLQVVQGVANKITMDEYATDSSIKIDGDARVDELDLDVATKVEGTGDIKDLNVGAAGSTVEQLPDNITIRPGITTDINGSEMDSTQAAESSADPRLLAGYPKVKNIAPNSATLVFSVNKPGTIYWAISAVADGSVDEDDLIEPPSYGGTIIKSGSISATAAKTEYTAGLTGLTQDGSYYVSAILVDGRGNRSPVKVTAFTTPDGTVPAFNQGYPVMTLVTTETAQVTVMTNKSCRLFYALLPAGSTAPTPADFKANSISGNLGYGVVDAVKNVTQPINVNSTRLQELTQYTLYLWLTDYDNAKSSKVYSLNFTTPDEQPPTIVSKEQTGSDATAIELTFSVNEKATLFWAIVPEGEQDETRFEGLDDGQWDPDKVYEPDNRRLQIKIENGNGSIKFGKKAVGTAYTDTKVNLNETRPLDPAVHGTTSFTMYLVAKDDAGNYSKIEKINVRVSDEERPTVEQQFSPYEGDDKTEAPVNSSINSIELVFSEKVRGSGSKEDDFLALYSEVLAAQSQTTAEQAAARNRLASALYKYIKLYLGDKQGDTRNPAPYCKECVADPATGEISNVTDAKNQDWVINYCYAQVIDRNGKTVVVFPVVKEEDGTVDKTAGESALDLASGEYYHFIVEGVVDLAEDANPLNPDPTELPPFLTASAKVDLDPGEELELTDNSVKKEIDFHFTADPQDVARVAPDQYWDMMIWSDTSMGFTLYSRDNENDTWKKVGNTEILVPSEEGFTYTSLYKTINGLAPNYEQVKDMKAKEYAIHVDWLNNSTNTNRETWNKTVKIRVSVVSATRNHLNILNGNGTTLEGTTIISAPKPFEMECPFRIKKAPEISQIFLNEKLDTSVDISVYLGDTPGMVYYLAFPLSSLKNGSNPVGGENITLTETMIQGVNSYYADLEVKENRADAGPVMPVKVPVMDLDPALNETPKPSQTELKVELPSKDVFIDNSIIPGVIKSSTNLTPVGRPATISLDKLQANTVYYICILTRGDSSDPKAYAEKAVCYRFTTQRAARPLLDLSGSGPVVNADPDRDATMDYFLASYGFENPVFRHPFSSTDTNKYAIADFDGNNNYTYEGKGKAMNVLTAMATPCYDSLNNYVGSVFDIFATDNAKNTYATHISTTAAQPGQIIETGKNHAIRPITGNTIPGSNIFDYTNNKDVKPGTEYVFVAVATGAKGSGMSFRAKYPVTKTDLEPPMITAAFVNVEKWNSKHDGIIAGTLTLAFGEDLYAMSRTGGGQTIYSICNCKLGAHPAPGGNPIGKDEADVKDRYWGVGYLASAASSSGILGITGKDSHTAGKTEAPIQEIVISITGLGQKDSATITFTQADIVDVVGNGQGRAPLTVTVSMVNKGTEASPNWQPEISGIARAWDARTN